MFVKRSGVLTVAALGIFICYYLFNNQQKTSKDDFSESVVAIRSAPLAENSLISNSVAADTKTLMAKSAGPFELNTLEKQIRKNICTEVFTSLSSKNIEEFFSELFRGDTKLKQTCFPEKYFDKEQVLNLFQNCNEPLKLNKEKLWDCSLKKMTLRSKLIDLLTKDQDLKKLSSNVLLNKIFALILSQTNKEEMFNKLQAFALELELREDGKDVGKKMNLFSYLVSDQNLSENHGTFDRLLKESLSAHPDDKELMQLFFYRQKTVLSAEALNNFVDYYLRKNPKDAFAHYMLANKYWHQEDRENTVRTLELCVNLDPQNQKYKDTLENARRVAFDSKIFTIELSLPL